MKRATFSLVVVAIAGFALIAISSGALSAAENPVYARIVVSPKCTVYVQFDGSEMRLATTAPGLKSAKAIKARRSSDQHASFAEVALPVAAQDMPTGLTKMTGQFDVMHFAGRRAAGQPESYVFGAIGLSKQDKVKATWTYTVVVSQEGGASPVEAKPVTIPDASKLRLNLTVKVAGQKVGPGLTLKAGALEVGEIRKNGKSMPAQVRVLDSAGKAVGSSKGPLGQFGFT
jgi:hypothetical protein